MIDTKMACPATFKYKSQVPDEGQRKVEGLKVRRQFPAKIPVSGRPAGRWKPIRASVKG